MKRRHFLAWITRIAGSYFGLAAGGSAVPHLLRINSVRLGEADAQVAAPCVCEASDQCLCEGSDAPGVCPADGGSTVCSKDTCSTDSSGTCHNSDVCNLDSSGNCRDDNCTDDSSGDCRSDSCSADSSGECASDSCTSGDSSKWCVSDSCDADSSGSCISDQCTADSAGDCIADNCTSDKSGVCRADTCTSDSSGYCRTDICPSDSSGDCRNDNCTVADSSGACVADKADSDSSKGCTSDLCLADSSGTCVSDRCNADSSGECAADRCSSDKSGGCTSDECYVSDTSGPGKADRCGSDSSGDCTQADVCVADSSGTCAQDLCRQDSGGNCTQDACALDQTPPVSQTTDKTGPNRALRWLYRISLLILALNLQPDQALAATVINAGDAVFFPDPVFTTSAALAPSSATSAFLRDCDNDGIDEADTNGDGACTGDPEVQDYNSDGSRELPAGTAFAGTFDFRCFYIPSDVVLVTSGAVSIRVSDEAAIFGSINPAGDFSIDAPGLIDLRTSAWLAPSAAALNFRTAAVGSVDQTQSGFPGNVPDISFSSICSAIIPTPAAAQIPLLPGLASILFAFLLALAGARRLTGRHCR